jgi:hypothetical protein
MEKKCYFTFFKHFLRVFLSWRDIFKIAFLFLQYIEIYRGEYFLFLFKNMFWCDIKIKNIFLSFFFFFFLRVFVLMHVFVLPKKKKKKKRVTNRSWFKLDNPIDISICWAHVRVIMLRSLSVSWEGIFWTIRFARAWCTCFVWDDLALTGQERTICIYTWVQVEEERT